MHQRQRGRIAPFGKLGHIADLVSFYPEKLTIAIDGEKLELGRVRQSWRTAPTAASRSTR